MSQNPSTDSGSAGAGWRPKTGHADICRNAGGLDGLDLIMCLGTVIAKVKLEDEVGSSPDPATVHSLAQLFVPRIDKAAAAS
ncbi:hypothetical protein ACF059_15055 [Streptomyces sp. NPDC016562]|uniref:hypothetical protein n=1 Tax=Streptomyces sp. NPDC016562 TaxID=3364966 RepID=UPI0036FBFFE8